MINWFFNNYFPLYKRLYYIYKNTTDKKIINWMNVYLKPGMVAVDIGANIGFYSELLSRKVGAAGYVYAYEPDLKNYHFLKLNCRKYNNLRMINSAVSDKRGFLNLYVSDNFNADHHTYKNMEKREKYRVSSISIDDEFHNKKLDFIKIDIQGYDFIALKGAERVIKKQKRIAIVGEYWPYGLAQAGSNPEEYLKFLTKIGLKVFLFKSKPTAQVIKNKHYYTNFIAHKGYEI